MRECVRTLLATALYFIQVDSKCMLPAPLALETYCKRKSQIKGAVIIVGMLKRSCFMQTNPASTGTEEKTEQDVGRQTTAGSLLSFL